MDEQQKTAVEAKPPKAPGPRSSGAVWRHVLLALVIFCCGVIVGIGGSVMVVHRGVMRVMDHGMPDARLLIGHIDAKLHLTDEQEREIQVIFEREFATVRDKRQEMSALMHEHYGRIRDDVAAVLTDEQREIWLQESAHAEKLFMPLHHGKHWDGHAEHGGNPPGCVTGAGECPVEGHLETGDDG